MLVSMTNYEGDAVVWSVQWVKLVIYYFALVFMFLHALLKIIRKFMLDLDIDRDGQIC